MNATGKLVGGWRERISGILMALRETCSASFFVRFLYTVNIFIFFLFDFFKVPVEVSAACRRVFSTFRRRLTAFEKLVFGGSGDRTS